MRFLERLGDSIIDLFATIGSFSIFAGRTIRWIFARPFDRSTLLFQMQEIGVKSVPVGVISSFFIGMVMALQLGGALEKYMQGISTFLGGGISVSMVRELAPVITSILLAGRVGSSIAAEIGTMRVTEQIDALVTLATDPIHYLSVPRFLAAIITIPMVSTLAILIGSFGGAVVSSFMYDIPYAMYLENARMFVDYKDLGSGVTKTFFFGAEIALVSCFTGFRAQGGAKGVGQATISAVVISLMMIIVSDYFITYIFQLFGW
ncbi:MAG: ABC transporter permease [Leptospirales bacterium]